MHIILEDETKITVIINNDQQVVKIKINRIEIMISLSNIVIGTRGELFCSILRSKVNWLAIGIVLLPCLERILQ